MRRRAAKVPVPFNPDGAHKTGLRNRRSRIEYPAKETAVRKDRS